MKRLLATIQAIWKIWLGVVVLVAMGLMAFACVCIFGFVFGCTKAKPDYMSSHEPRVICHLAFRAGDFRGQELDLPLWIVYDKHVYWHPNDYWGRCKPEDIKSYEEPVAKPEESRGAMTGRRKKL